MAPVPENDPGSLSHVRWISSGLVKKRSTLDVAGLLDLPECS